MGTSLGRQKQDAYVDAYDEGNSSKDMDSECSSSCAHDQTDLDTLCDLKRSDQLLDTACKCWKSKLYTDVTVVVGRKRFPAHRLVLASLSDYFPPLMEIDASESGEVTIHNLDPDIFEILLKFAYTGEVEVTKATVSSVLISADYLNIGHVKDACVKFMTANLDPDNVCDVLVLAMDYSLPKLVENTHQFLRENLSDVSRTHSFSQLDPKILAKFLDDDDLILYSYKVGMKSRDRELLILNSVLRYLSGRSNMEPEVVEMMIRTVRLAQLPVDTILKCLAEFSTLDKNEIIRKYVGLRKSLHIQEKQPNTSSKNMKVDMMTDIPSRWLQTRRLAAFDFVQSMRYAAGGQITPTPDPPQVEYKDSNLEIKSINIWLRTWDERTVIGGLSLTFRNASHDAELKSSRGNCSGTSDHSVELEPNEFIVKVIVGSGYLIDRLGFKTNRGRSLGPFGGPGGSRYTEMAPSGPSSYLYDINCDSVVTQGSEAILNLMLRWIFFQ